MAQTGKESSGCGDFSKENFCARLAEVRARFSLSQAEMAEKCDVSLRAYRNYEYGEREPTISAIHSLINTLEINPNWLITGSGKMILVAADESSIDIETFTQAISAVEKLSDELIIPIPTERKARLVTLLYKQSQLIEEVTGDKPNNLKLAEILRLAS